MFNTLPDEIRSLETKATFRRARSGTPKLFIIYYVLVKLILLILCCVISCTQDLHENLLCVDAAYLSKIKFTTTTTTYQFISPSRLDLVQRECFCHQALRDIVQLSSISTNFLNFTK